MTHRVLAVAVAALVSCGGGGAADTVEPIQDADSLWIRIAYQGLCDARTLAEAGDVQSAADTFESRAHAELHTLADRLSASDRDAAARLLEAKQQVEAVLSDPVTAAPETVAAGLLALEAEVANAAETLGLDRPTCGGAGA
jgi:hypothetical protein